MQRKQFYILVPRLQSVIVLRTRLRTKLHHGIKPQIISKGAWLSLPIGSVSSSLKVKCSCNSEFNSRHYLVWEVVHDIRQKLASKTFYFLQHLKCLICFFPVNTSGLNADLPSYIHLKSSDSSSQDGLPTATPWLHAISPPAAGLPGSSSSGLPGPSPAGILPCSCCPAVHLQCGSGAGTAPTRKSH